MLIQIKIFTQFLLLLKAFANFFELLPVCKDILMYKFFLKSTSIKNIFLNFFVWTFLGLLRKLLNEAFAKGKFYINFFYSNVKRCGSKDAFTLFKFEYSFRNVPYVSVFLEHF